MPDVYWGDMYNYLVNNLVNNLRQRESLQITGSFQLFMCNHVQEIYYNEIAKIFQYQNKGIKIFI